MLTSTLSAASGIWAQWLIFALYMAIILGIAIFTRKKSKSIDGFMFANKGVGGWLSAFAYGATYFSAVVFVGYAGKFGWAFGLSSLWMGIGNMLIGTLAAWLILAKRTKYMTTTLGARTMPEFFEKRYNSKYIKLVASLVIFVFLLPYSASVYQGMGYIFEAVLHIDATWCIVILAGLTAIYLFLGGYFATTITDFVQGIIMIVGIVVVVFMLMGNEAVNWGEGLKALTENGLGFIPSGEIPAGKTFLDSPAFNIVILVLLTSFGIWGLPQSIHKFYAVKDNKAIKRGAVISTCFAAIVGCGAYLMGSMVTLFIDKGEFTGALGGNFDKLVPEMLVQNLPSALLGLIIVLLFAASMSTLAALSLSSSSTVTMDFAKGYIKPNMADKNTNILLRVLCLVFVAISAVLAIAEIDAIVNMMSLSWGTIAGCFIGPYVYGLYSKKANKAGAYASIIASLVVTFALVIGLGYYVLGAEGIVAPNFGDVMKAGIGRSPFIGVLAMAGSMIATPLFSWIFASKCKIDSALIKDLFPNSLRHIGKHTSAYYQE
ncbi:MAG: sodium:solute symporter family protein [Clostridia bacterium]